jgi:hypothetical protein
MKGLEVLFILTHYFLSVKYEENDFRLSPQMSIWFNLVIRML